MTHISPQEADKFENYSLRLSEIDDQLLRLSKKKELTNQETQLVTSLQVEKAQIENWFRKTSK